MLSALRILLWIVACFLTAMPAMAEGPLDRECYSNSNATQADYTVCRQAHGGLKSCLASYASDFRDTASTCVAAAQAHYDVGAGYEGYASALEFGIAGQELLDAAEANVYLFHHDLALSQVQSAIDIFSRIQSDSSAGDLAGKAAKMLDRAHAILQQAKTLG
jgi:hypothetical protein